MVLDQVISERTISVVRDITESKAFYSTMVYPAAVSIIAGIALYFLITRQEFTRRQVIWAAEVLNRTWRYMKGRRIDREVSTIYKSFEKKKTLNTTALLEFGSLALSGVIILSILTKTLFLAVVTTQSMAPLIMPGDLIVTQAFAKNITVGDVIVFIPPDGEQMVIHRVTSISEDGIRTKGDNALPDTWRLGKDNIKGKAISISQKPLVIKGLGYYLMPIDNPIKAQDPALKATRGYIEMMQKFGPLISIIILIFTVLSLMRK